MENYILAQSWARANIQDRLWYVMDEADKETLKQKETIIFGDKCYVLTTGEVYIMGNDQKWYVM